MGIMEASRSTLSLTTIEGKPDRESHVMTHVMDLPCVGDNKIEFTIEFETELKSVESHE